MGKWMGEDALKDHILRAEISERLDSSPCALITSRFGWTANMQRIIGSQTHSKTNDMQKDYYLNQKKAMEINPRHPLIKELLRRVEDNPDDAIAKDMSLMMFNTATLRSGYFLKDTSAFAMHIENMMRETLGIDKDEQVEEEKKLSMKLLRKKTMMKMKKKMKTKMRRTRMKKKRKQETKMNFKLILLGIIIQNSK